MIFSPTMRSERLTARFLPVAALALVGLWLAAIWTPVAASSGAERFSRTLSGADRRAFEDYLSAQAVHDFKMDAYWREVTDKRALRRGKRSRKEPFTAKDYVRTLPPTYTGPTLSAGLEKRWKAFQTRESEQKKAPPRRTLPGVDDFLAMAKSEYGFTPERIPEREFKRRYAREALAAGLTADQVLRVYALETGGLGTADMVAGIHPIRKTGTPISSAIGYAQLLTANTTDELVKHGPDFLERLKRMANQSGISDARRRALVDKHKKLSAMLRAARSVPHRWSEHMALARTRKGQAIHAINIDGDIGPWLQVKKLQDIKKMADNAGRTNLSGAEIELMNLAGPGTGLEMMRPAGLKVPTSNFFVRDAYYRNTIVRGKTSAELLVALNERMDKNLQNSGAIEFAEVFREVRREMASRR